MSQPAKRWEITPRAPADHLAKFPDLSPLVVQILHNRGIVDPVEVADFLNHGQHDDDPFRLKGMLVTVDRLRQAIVHQEPIAIYGDYDVDGVTSTTVVVQMLMALQAQVRPYIPNRFDEGYGLNNDALTELAEQGVKVVLTVDCGIRSVNEVIHGNSLGLDMIITDHHSVGAELPPALAVINPKQADCNYPFKELAGVGLAYKLVQAMLQTDIPNPQGIKAEDFLDLVALGTVADLAPLHGENRALAAHGLRKLNQSLRPGLSALLQESGTRPVSITAGTIGFVLGPRLNAAGRLDSAWAAYNLLMAKTEFEAIHMAQQLDLQNKERQKLTHEMVEIARQAVLADEGQSPIYLISHQDFNPGVVGLAASRLVEEFYRPVLVAERGATETKGSARSIAEFHVTAALDKCADLLLRYGGHAAAAGFTLKNENVAALQERLLSIAHGELNMADLRPTISLDAEVNLRGVRPSLVQLILDLEPFGIGNPTPRFCSRNLTVKQCRTVGQDQKHLKLTLFDGKQDWDAIGFQLGHWLGQLTPGREVDIAYNLEFNEWQGQKKMQLGLKDIRLSEAG